MTTNDYYYLTKEDMDLLKKTFKIPPGLWKSYDLFLDGIHGGMTRASKIKENYALPDLNGDALWTILNSHGYAFELVEDHIIYPKKKVKK